MRKFFIAAWLLLPVGAWAYHEGPGQEKLQLDAVDVELEKAKEAAAEAAAAEPKSKVAKKAYLEAAKLYEAALKELPALDTPELKQSAQRIKLSAAKAKLEGGKLIEARKELTALVDEFESAEDANESLEAEAREGLANAQYYYTWLMRLEGASREAWEPEIEIARQNFRLLAEDADKRGEGTMATAHMEDLESAIKLARLDLEELQGLPLPSQ